MSWKRHNYINRAKLYGNPTICSVMVLIAVNFVTSHGARKGSGWQVKGSYNDKRYRKTRQADIAEIFLQVASLLLS